MDNNAERGPSVGPAILVRNLRVVRGARTVLPDLSFEVPHGQVTGLLGPSGSGKSTLMRALVGVQRVQGGTVEVLGRPAGSAALRNRVGYVTQAPSVYPEVTEKLVEWGITSVSVSPDMIDRTREIIANAEVKLGRAPK